MTTAPRVEYPWSDAMAEGHAGYLDLLDEMRNLHLRKAEDYGSDEDPLQNLRACKDIGLDPIVGTWVRAKDKVQRIDQYFRKGNLVNESVEDSLMDLAAYALLTLTLIREGQ
jgi:hypothetical protein